MARIPRVRAPSPTFVFDAPGVANMIVDLKRRKESVLKAAEAGMYLAAQLVMTEAKQEAPLDLGTLQGSGYVTHPQRRGTRVSLELGFGGQAEDYALVQHEVPMEHSEPGRKDHYLSDPMHAAESRTLRIISEHVLRALNGDIPQAVPEEHPSRPDTGATKG